MCAYYDIPIHCHNGVQCAFVILGVTTIEIVLSQLVTYCFMVMTQVLVLTLFTLYVFNVSYAITSIAIKNVSTQGQLQYYELVYPMCLYVLLTTLIYYQIGFSQKCYCRAIENVTKVVVSNIPMDNPCYIYGYFGYRFNGQRNQPLCKSCTQKNSCDPQ